MIKGPTLYPNTFETRAEIMQFSQLYSNVKVIPANFLASNTVTLTVLNVLLVRWEK